VGAQQGERMGRVSGKVCLVTGGAMGLGEACARRLSDEGAHVMLTDVAETQGRAVAASIGDAAAFMLHDVQEEEAWERVMAATLERFGRLDVLVNNAGISKPGSIEDTSFELWRSIQAINSDGVFLGCRAAVRAMKGHGGSIVNMSSSLGIRSNGAFAAYSASKGAVRLLTKSVALHCGESGYKIRCNSVHPGAIRTPMFESFIALAPDRETGERMFAANHPLGHVGEPSDIASAVLFLASDESAFVTGCELTVDGGLCIG
jgi:3(or 17)beta-hydroxysteroid dehydrogenase